MTVTQLFVAAVTVAVAASMAAVHHAAASQSPPAPSPSPPQARSGGPDLAADADVRIRELQREADALARRSGSVLGDLRALALQRAIHEAAATKAAVALNDVTAALQQSTARASALAAERQAQRPGVRRRMVEIYKRGRRGFLPSLLAAGDLRALGRLTRGAAQAAALDRLRIDSHRRTLQAELRTSAELDARQAELAKARADADRVRQSLAAAERAQQARLAELDEQRDLAARYAGELQSAAALLQQRVDALPASAATTLPVTPFRGALEWPVAGRVLSNFGPATASRTRAATSASASGSGSPRQARNGIEIAASDGQAVHAVHGGVVSFAEPFTGFGTLVIVDHGAGTFSLYGHLRESGVTAGAAIDRGSVVGRAGRRPDAIEAVYFELRIDGRAVDPVEWLRGSPR